ncbi:MAG TPA: aminotransferase class V-fold PLP-dependent enzyme, partial [Mycobacteriales bacterium]|nr:aminotransferase class V-fold PLP-dependent enzyme [Mycobacteriales bacterium]
MPPAGPAETRAPGTPGSAAEQDGLRGFFDAVGGGPLHPLAAQALQVGYDAGSTGVWADPRALHGRGRHARRLADGAREAIAGVLGVRPDEVRLTGSGDVARRTAVVGLAAARHRAGSRVVTSAVEQAAVLDAAGEAGQAVAVAVDERGHLDLDAFTAAVLGGTACAAVQHTNREVGTVQDLAAVAAVCGEARVPLVVDLAA